MGRSVFLELDAVLDTRLAVMASIDPEAAAKLAGSLKYYHRLSDDFSELTGIEHQRYQEAFAQRDATVLPESFLTGIPKLLTRLISDLEIEQATAPTDGPLEVELNLWPYQVTRKVEVTLADALTHYCGTLSVVKTVNIPLSELTPTYLRQRFGGFILYNFNEWIVSQGEALRLTPIPQLTAIAPALFHGRVLTENETRPTPDADPVDPFQLTEMILGSMLHTEFADPAVFSMFGKPPAGAT